MSLTETIATPPSLPASLPRSSATFTTAPSVDRSPSSSSATPSPNSHLRNPRSQKSFSSISTKETDEAAWGSNFWVTLVDPQASPRLYPCVPVPEPSISRLRHRSLLVLQPVRLVGIRPSETLYYHPVPKVSTQKLILSSSAQHESSGSGEWWELSDESRGGLPYYYQTKTGETVWERPSSAFVIPLGIIQVRYPLNRIWLIFNSDPEHSTWPPALADDV